MTMLLEVTVPGDPVPQGSIASFAHYRSGKVVTPQKQAVVQWRDKVAWAARQAGVPAEPSTDPVSVNVDFWIGRPRSHYGTGRNHGQLRPSAPAWCTTRPDGDKLLRAVCDALTGVVWRDDSQIVVFSVGKFWADSRDPCVRIEVQTVGSSGERVG